VAGIKGLDGFMAEYLVDDPRYIVEEPRELLDVAVLAQPLSDLEKSIESLLITQRRMIWSC
jgi:aldose 1-dehydrogenase [NAD(P)+]